MTILTLAGSPSLRSRSSGLLRHVAQALARHGQAIREIGLRDVPAQDLIEGHYAGASAGTLRAQVADARVLVVSTPIYKASLAGGLKALLDLLDEKALAGKIVLPIATGGSSAHLLALEYGLKPVLSALGARHILAGVYATDQDVGFDETGALRISEAIHERLNEAVASVLAALGAKPRIAAKQEVRLPEAIAAIA
ncbi:NADPH-dependent FMN reductase [Bordetella avium]|nr:NADPH-dependent FMN reductase [Bordetella avium]AZY49196.1 FMN reductase (NADPH) [Bordetella avium]AZY54294.1 FMN reductase (NADPH) [Bordetella avium]RIQ12344.1 FMN reductase (NADPH) [Bordetella avium]RIQ19432.1 FMN reductase (NADPH) [Bordetella avium]RIQ33582.1 FMN reductase (NADPH) [Bordetella avium]